MIGYLRARCGKRSVRKTRVSKRPPRLLPAASFPQLLVGLQIKNFRRIFDGTDPSGCRPPKQTVVELTSRHVHHAPVRTIRGKQKAVLARFSYDRPVDDRARFEDLVFRDPWSRPRRTGRSTVMGAPGPTVQVWEFQLTPGITAIARSARSTSSMLWRRSRNAVQTIPHDPLLARRGHRS